jgi:hypothetical protein
VVRTTSCRLRAALLLGGCVAFALVMLALQTAMRADWVPWHTLASAPLRFLHYQFVHAPLWWDRFLAIYALWAIVVASGLLYAREIGAALGKAFLPAVLAVQAVGLAAMIASPLPLDSDQFAYVYYASLTERGVNPYGHYEHSLLLTANERRIAPTWGNPPVVDRYGAGWTLANAIALWPFRNAPVEVQARILRVWASLCALGCTLLLWIALRRFQWRPAATIAFALNPLVILASGDGGHNDIYVVLAGLGAYLLAERRWYELAACLLAASVQAKFAYAPFLLPLLAVTFATTRSGLRTLLTAAVFGVVAVALSLPLSVKLSLTDVALAFNATHTPLFSSLVWRVLRHFGLGHAITPHAIAPVFPAFVAACSLAIAVLALRRKREPLLEFALFIGILLLPYKVESWYGIMMTPMLLIPRRWAPAAFFAVTVACELLQRRIFRLYDPTVYVMALLLGVAVGVALWLLMRQPRTATTS